MEIKFPVELFLAGSVALLIWKLLGFLKVSYWLVAAPILFWIFIPYVLIVLLFGIWGIYIAIRFVMLSIVIAILWTVLFVADTFEAIRIKRLDKKALKEFEKWGIN